MSFYGRYCFAIGNLDVDAPICWLYENNGVRQVRGVAACTVGWVIEMGISLCFAAVTRFLLTFLSCVNTCH